MKVVTVWLIIYVHHIIVGCGSGYFYCTADNLCMPDQYVCDTRWNCMDGEDEKNCGTIKHGERFKSFYFSGGLFRPVL